MQSTEDGYGDDLARVAAPLAWSRKRDPLTQSLVRPHRAVIANILREHGLQVPHTQDDDVVEGLSPYTSEKPLACCIHQRRLDRCANDPSACSLGRV